MTLNIAKVLLRTTGLVTGLLGTGMLYAAFAMLSDASSEQVASQPGLMLLIPMFAFAVYFLYVGYVTCFKFSPGAVRHLCAVIAVYALMLLVEVFGLTRGAEQVWVGFAFLGCCGFAFWAYRIASDRLNRWLFP